MNSDASGKDKYKHLTNLFDEHSGRLERRVGTSVERDEAQICTSIAVLTFTHSILPDILADACVSRLTIVTKEFSLQGVYTADPPRTLDASLRTRIEATSGRQVEIVEAVVKRWILNESAPSLKLTRSESRAIQGLAVDLAAIFKDLEESFNNGNLNRLEVTWILTSFCHFLVGTAILLWESPKASSFVRAGQLVIAISGLQLIFCQL